MPADVDQDFYDRADAHINLSNDQMEKISRGKVSASMMYGLARFNAWVSATGFENAVDMKEKRGATLAYFIEQYSQMLEENFDDYAANFDKYMKPMN